MINATWWWVTWVIWLLIRMHMFIFTHLGASLNSVCVCVSMSICVGVHARLFIINIWCIVMLCLGQTGHQQVNWPDVCCIITVLHDSGIPESGASRASWPAMASLELWQVQISTGLLVFLQVEANGCSGGASTAQAEDDARAVSETNPHDSGRYQPGIGYVQIC